MPNETSKKVDAVQTLEEFLEGKGRTRKPKTDKTVCYPIQWPYAVQKNFCKKYGFSLDMQDTDLGKAILTQFRDMRKNIEPK